MLLCEYPILYFNKFFSIQIAIIKADTHCINIILCKEFPFTSIGMTNILLHII